MPIIESAKKYMRVTQRKTLQNKKIKGSVKTAVKKTRETIAAGNVTEAKEWYKKAQKAIDKAAQKKIMKKNTAARQKSRLNRLVKAAAEKK
jgi:small subunit ribosomal protein S20